VDRSRGLERSTLASGMIALNASKCGPIELMRSTSGWLRSTMPSMYINERMMGKASSPKVHPAKTAVQTIFIICCVSDTSLTEVPTKPSYKVCMSRM